jgi:4-amino-4-deoxy-L-arabinose transferase-like glycosyltransferase
VLEIVVTKLPHYVLALYPAIAILIAGIVDAHALATAVAHARNHIMVRDPGGGGHRRHRSTARDRPGFGLQVWPVIGLSAVTGLFARRLYEAQRAELSLLRAHRVDLTVTALFGLIVPMLGPLFPSATLARSLRNSPCGELQVAAAGYHEPSLVFWSAPRCADGCSQSRRIPGAGDAGSPWSRRARSVISPSARRRSGCVIRCRAVSRRSISSRRATVIALPLGGLP